MTGYTVHTGSTEDFAAGWDQIFRKNAGAKSKTAKATPAKSKSPTAKKSKKKSSAKPSHTRKGKSAKRR